MPPSPPQPVMSSPSRAPRELLRRGLLVVGLTVLAVALGLLALGRTGAGAASFAAIAREARWELVALGVLGISLSQVVAAIRWRCLLPPPASTEGRLGLLTGIQCVGLLFNYALPGPVGELVAATMVSRRYRLPLSGALVAGLVMRLIGLGVAGLIAGIAYVGLDLELPPGWDQAIAAVVTAMVGGSGVVILAALRPEGFRRLARRLLSPLEAAWNPLGGGVRRLHAAGEQVLDALVQTARRGPRPLLRAALWTAVGHTLSPCGLALAALGMGVKAGWIGVIFTNNFVIVGSLALFLFPGSQLGWDLLYGGTLALATGISLPDAAALVALGRLQQSAMVLIGVGALLLLARQLLPETLPFEAP